MSKKNQRRGKDRGPAAAPKRLEGAALERAVDAPLRTSYEALQRGDSARAEEVLRDAIRRFGRHPRLFANLMAAIEHQGRPEDALRVADAAVETFPGDASLWNTRGAVLKFLGRLDEARSSFARALELAPASTAAWRNHAGLKTFTAPDDPDLVAMEELLASLPARSDGRAPLYFALARAHDQLGDTARAFGYYERGNRAARGLVRFDRQGAAAAMGDCATTYGADWMARGPVEGASDAAPVLVVGMPRSGSTLIEQVLASHPAVVGVGEVPELPRAVLARTGPTQDLARAAAALSDADLASVGRIYGKALARRAPEAERVVDKYLTNYLYAGLLPRILPRARVIHAVRDARDNAWGCYKVSFTSNVPYAYDFDDIATVMAASRELVAHLDAVAPGLVLTVRYEDMVDDLEGQTRRMLEFLGLPWDDACLRFHETQRQVNSASALQVRQPLYRTALGAWERYREHLAPMERALAAAGLV